MFSLESREYLNAALALESINALLPDEYKIQVNTQRYNELVSSHVKISCTHCEGIFEFNTIKILEVLLSFFVSSVTNQKTDKIWFCPKCKNKNRLKNSKIIKEQLQEPFYLKVIPACPKREITVGRSAYHNDFSKWFYNYLKELESQLGIYRHEYAGEEENLEFGLGENAD